MKLEELIFLNDQQRMLSEVGEGSWVQERARQAEGTTSAKAERQKQ